MKIIDSVSGKLREPDDMFFADRLIKMSKEVGIWRVIEEIVSYWKIKHPESFKSLIIDITDARESSSNKFSSSKSGMRYLADIPQQIMSTIRVVYPDEVFDKQFFREFAKRFPEFRVAEKI